ncbi:MAG: tetratricopeptide repeat protein [Myxococcota bacterium]|nr:tetratricopeptide repeat protein [Myxococcota bacterium]
MLVRSWIVVAMLALASCIASMAAESAEWDDPVVDRLVREGTRQNDDGDYDAAAETWARLRAHAPVHPAPHVHAVDTLYWLQVQSDDRGGFDEAIARECAAAIRKGEAWVAARPQDARAHFYLGQALFNRGRLHGMRAELYRAYRLGERGRLALERALALDPALHDAKFSLGLYAFYASQVPSLFKWLDFLWFIPKGDAEQGLRYFDEVYRYGERYRLTGGFFLSHALTFYEDPDLARALAVTRELHARHPRNSIVHFDLVDLLLMVSDYEGAMREARALEAHPDPAEHHRGRANMARIWRARIELHRGRPEEAWTILETFGADGPANPDWGNRWVRVTRGQILDVQGQRARALAEYQHVASLDVPRNPRSMVAARAGLEAPFQLDLPPVIAPVETKEAGGS